MNKKKIEKYILLILSGIFVVIITGRIGLFFQTKSIPQQSNKYPVNLNDIPSYLYKPYEQSIVLEPDLNEHISMFYSGGKCMIDNQSSIFSPISDHYYLLFKKYEFIKLRLKKIKKYKILGFYHPDYNPFRYYHFQVYQRVNFKKSWLYPIRYYIVNPYQLIILTKANHVTPLNLHNKNFSLRFDNGRMIETYTGKEAKSWFRSVFQKSDHPGKVWAIAVNGWDAGFFYTMLDIYKSKNIQNNYSISNILNSPNNGRYTYQVGQYKVNNIGPSKHDSWITLKKGNVFTKFYFKMWRTKPDLPSSKPQLIYEIIINPD
ncbi:MAG: hypothetical protein ABFR75_13285 [Acidobacteriota bacterium]